MRILLTSLLLLSSASLYANPPTYNYGWQWNNNVKVQFIYTYWKNGVTHVKLDNGEFCYIKPDEKNNLSAILAIRAQQATVQVVCAETPDKTVDSRDSRHIHRIRY